MPWTGLLAGVSTGKYDVAITAAIITKERTQSLDFTSPIADATHYYVKRKDDTSISSIKDLNGKTCRRPGRQRAARPTSRARDDAEEGWRQARQGGRIHLLSGGLPGSRSEAVDYVVNTIINLKTLVTEKPNVFEIGQPVSGKSFPAWALKRTTPTCWPT